MAYAHRQQQTHRNAHLTALAQQVDSLSGAHLRPQFGQNTGAETGRSIVNRETEIAMRWIRTDELVYLQWVDDAERILQDCGGDMRRAQQQLAHELDDALNHSAMVMLDDSIFMDLLRAPIKRIDNGALATAIYRDMERIRAQEEQQQAQIDA